MKKVKLEWELLAMNRIKDFFHNVNDIILAIVIIAAAAGIIYWRMNVIMAYPESSADATSNTETVQQTDDQQSQADGESAQEEK